MLEEPMGDLYRLYDSGNRLLYIGISLNAAKRMAEHRHEKSWWHEVARIDLERVPAMKLRQIEEQSIRDEQPYYNIVHAHYNSRTRIAEPLQPAIETVIAVSPARAAEMLDCSRQFVYLLMERGELRRFKIGRAARIPVADIYALLS